jgi:hypothetical protein
MYNEESVRDTSPRRMNHNKQANQKGGVTKDKICRKTLAYHNSTGAVMMTPFRVFATIFAG